MKKSKTTVAAVMLPLFVILIILIWKRFVAETPQMRFVKKMGAGINVGNSLDSNGLKEYRSDASDLEYEFYWGNPEITEELFVMIKEAGFSTVRIPVTWEEHMDDKGQISEIWMNRVQEVVDMALAQELYVILNMHHEEWMDLQLEKETEIVSRFQIAWEQIAKCFADYDERLLFEGMNEPRLRGSEYEWTSGTEDLRNMVNRLNFVFVDTVRSTGRMNAERYLLITPYASNHLEESMADLVVPDGNIIVSIHMYVPYAFCQDEEGMTTWDILDEKCAAYASQVQKYFGDMNRLFIQKGIPVILTEYGCKDKNNLDSRLEWIRLYMKEADKNGIQCVWWDNGSSYQIMDRENYTWIYPELVKELVK